MWWALLSVIALMVIAFRGKFLAKRHEKNHAAILKSATLRHDDLIGEFNYDLYRLVKDTPGATEFIDELKGLATDIRHLSLHHATLGKLSHAEKIQLLADWHRFCDHLIEAISPAVNDYPIKNLHTWRMEVAAEGIVLKKQLTGMLES